MENHYDELIQQYSDEERLMVRALHSRLFKDKPIEMTDMVIAALAGNLKFSPPVTVPVQPGCKSIDFQPSWLHCHEALTSLLRASPYSFDPELLNTTSHPGRHTIYVNAVTDGILKAMDSSFGLITPDTATAVHNALDEDPARRDGFDHALTQHLHNAAKCAGASAQSKPLVFAPEPGFAAQKPSTSWFLEETKGYSGLEFSSEMVEYTIVPMFEHNPFRAMFVLSRVDRLCKTFDIKAEDHANAWAYVCENIPSPDVRLAPVHTPYQPTDDVEPWQVVETLVFTAATRYAKMMSNVAGVPPLSFATLTALIGYVHNEDRRRILVEMF